jgi:hypothetical protein
MDNIVRLRSTKSRINPCSERILLNAESKFPKEAIIKYNLACYCCQLGEIDSAKNYLKKAFEIDSGWRLQALDDEDLKPFWDSLRAII